MENLTHTIVGLMLARVGLDKTTPRGAGMMMLAANAPDIDAVFWFGGTLPYLTYHRTYTHSFVFLPLMALLPMLIVRASFSWRSWAASMAGVASHILLDWTNPYGIPFATPLSAHRFRLDAVNLVDFWIWAILLGTLAAASFMRARRGWAWVALILLVTYEGVRLFAHERAVNVMAAQRYEGAPPHRVTALPGAASPLRWRGIVEGGGFVIVAPVDLGAEYDPRAGRLYRTPAPTPAMEAALRTPPFAVFRRFAQVPFWRVTPLVDGVRLDLTDLRFGTPESPGFAAVSAIVDSHGVVRRAGFGL